MMTKKFSRVIALLLALVMLLGTLPTSYAESSTIVNNAEYDALLNAAVAGYYDELMACETYEEMREVSQRIEYEQGYAFMESLTDEQLELFNAAVEERYSDYLVRTTYYKTVDFTKVAPFRAPVTGEAASVMRVMALAADEGDSSDSTTQDNGIELRKSVSDEPNSDGEYTLTLEAWVTGTKVITEVKKDVPTDIILVLDQSGSMENDFDTYTYSAVDASDLNQRTTYYVESGDAYVAVTYCNNCNAWTRGCSWFFGYHLSGGDKYTPKTSENDTTVGNVQFYSRSQSNQSRLQALKTAVTKFVNSVNEKAKGTDGAYGTADDIDHRVAVVGFGRADYGNTPYYNTEVFIGATQYKYGTAAQGQYDNALQDMSTETGMNNVTASIDALDAEGGTYVDLGIEMANGILNANPVPSGEERNRVVVIFTDGAPGYNGSYGNGSYGSSGDAAEVVSAAMTQVGTTKTTHGATVYTVGIFEGADATSAGSNANNSSANQRANYLMQNLSSNNGTVQTPSYYLSASDSESLNNIFEQIADNVESGTQTGTLTEESITMDVVAPSFELPEGAEGAVASDIKLYTAQYNGKDANGEYTFTNKTEFSGTVTVNKKEQTIAVEGFDFAENWVGTSTVNDKASNHGYELIIEIPIVVTPGFLGGNGVPTNADGSGIYVDADADEPIEEFNQPSLDVEVEEITPTIVDQHIYISNKADLLNMIGLDDTTGFYEYTLNGETYSIDGTNNGYVDITYTFKDGETVIATVTIPAGKTSKDVNDIVITGNTEVYLTADKTYTITCEVAPVNEGTYNETSSTTSGTVYVYKPVLTFEDTDEEYLAEYPSLDDESYFEEYNYVSTAWQRADGKPSTEVAMSGTAPSIKLTYTADGTLLTNGVVESKTDVSVNVSVALEGDDTDSTYTDYTAHSSSIRLDCACVDANCEYKSEGAMTNMGNAPEFIVHVYNVYGSLKFSKEVVNTTGFTPAANAFTFTVTLGDSNSHAYTITNADGTDATPENATITGSGTITLTDGQSATIAELPPQTTYTVTETSLLGYTSTMTTVEDNGTAGEIDAGKTDTLKFTNTYATGSLAISKNVVGTYAPTTDTFEFTVSLPNGTYTIKNGDGTKSSLTVTTGSATITLVHGQTATISGIPAGWAYGVTETVTAGYQLTSSTGTSGTIVANAMQTAAFTNTYQYQQLTINKEVKDSTFTEGYKTFTFTITAADGTENTQTVKVNTDTKTGSVSVVLPVGRYDVTETPVDGYATTYQVGQTATTDTAKVTLVVGSDASISVVNTANSVYSSIPVTKNWVDNSDELGERPTSIVVKLNATYDEKTVAIEPTWSTTTGDIWTGSWTNVPKFDSNGNEIVYTVTEDAVTNYTDTITGNPANGYQITNRIAVGDLTISKQVKDSTFATGTKIVTFTVTGPENYSNTVELTVSPNATASTTIENLPIGSYTVTESAVDNVAAANGKIDGYATTMNGEDGLSATVTVPAGSNVAANAVNTANSSRTIAITKVWDDNNNTLELRPESIAVTLSGNGQSYTEFTWDKTLDETENKWTTSISVPMFDANGNEITYTVAETPVTHYSAPVVTGDAATGFTVINSIAVGDLTISKTVVNNTGFTPEADEFTFSVKLSDTLNSYSYTVADKNGDDVTPENATISNGAGTIVLKHGYTATIANLPNATTYTVTETGIPLGFTVNTAEIEGAIAAGTVSACEFINTYVTGSLKISKTGLEGVDANASTLYRVTSEDINATGNGIDLTVVINGNSSVTINHLPLGTYKVEELTDWSWRYEPKTGTQSEQTATITATQNGSAAFENSRNNNQWLDGETSAENAFTGIVTE